MATIKGKKVISFKAVDTKKGYKILKKTGEYGVWKAHRPPKKASKNKIPPNGILIVRAGIENVWEPDDKDMDKLADLFLAATENPGSVVVVRNGVDTYWLETPTK